MARTRGSGEKRLTKEDWLKSGLEALKHYGYRGLNIEPLAEYIGVTKGSFYWHFKDREEFLNELIDYWERELTTKVFDYVTDYPGDAKQKLYGLMEFVFEEGSGTYDPDIRSWAVWYSRAAEVVKRVDEERLMFVKRLFRQMGFSDPEVEFRSRIFYLYMVGEFSVFMDEDEDTRKRYLKEKHAFFTSK